MSRGTSSLRERIGCLGSTAKLAGGTLIPRRWLLRNRAFGPPPVNLPFGFYQTPDGAVVEFMEYSESPFENR
jgi:hypothetical protein